MSKIKRRKKHNEESGLVAGQYARQTATKPSVPGVAPRVDTGLLEGLFPRGSQWVIFGVTLVFRLMYVTNRRHWWLLHPDEVYQSVEGELS